MSHPECSHFQVVVKRVGTGTRQSAKPRSGAGAEHPCQLSGVAAPGRGGSAGCSLLPVPAQVPADVCHEGLQLLPPLPPEHRFSFSRQRLAQAWPGFPGTHCGAGRWRLPAPRRVPAGQAGVQQGTAGASAAFAIRAPSPRTLPLFLLPPKINAPPCSDFWGSLSPVGWEPGAARRCLTALARRWRAAASPTSLPSRSDASTSSWASTRCTAW